MPTVLISSPFDAYDGNEPYVFVSYAHIDAAAVYPEINKMHQNGVRIWFDKGIEEGSEWPAEIEKALNNCSVFIVFLSRHAVESVNIRNEIHLALKKKKEFLAIYLEKTELKFGLELTISSLQHVTKRQTGEYWEKIWKFLSAQPRIFDETRSQAFFSKANQNLIFNHTPPPLVVNPFEKQKSLPKFLNNLKYFGLIGSISIAIAIFAILGFLFLIDKNPNSSTSSIVIKAKNGDKNLISNQSAKEAGDSVGEVSLINKAKNDVKDPARNLSNNEKNNKNEGGSSVSNSGKKSEKLFTEGLLVSPFDEATAKKAQDLLANNLQKKVIEFDDFGKGVMHEMVLIPAGKFMMGSPDSEVGRNENETQHEVTLTKPFYMGKYEVTQEQWEIIMGTNPSQFKNLGLNLPITDVSWGMCKEFINKLNSKTKGGYRLPTEAEWEYACRAGTTTAYFFGDSITKNDCNFGGGVRPKKVGSYKPNSFGLYDMHGNVWELCEDWRGDYPAYAVTDPKGPDKGTIRVGHGGSGDTRMFAVRSASRGGLNPSGRGGSVGFRLVRTILN